MEPGKVKALIEKMRKDGTFRARILAIEDIDERMKFVAKEGFDCKIDDVQHYLRHYVGKDGTQAVVLTEKKGCNGIYYGFCF